MAYLLDANVFIQARNLHYGFDFCPAFWNWLEAEHAKGVVLSVERVQDELEDDQLAAWAADQTDTFFVQPDDAVLPSLRAVATWAAGAGYEQGAINIFLQAADYYLVAQAHAGGHVVVTHEVLSSSTKKIKIPDACIGMGVKYTSPFQMLRAERARFVLEKPET